MQKIHLKAPQSTVDKDGRRVLVAWARMPETTDGLTDEITGENYALYAAK